MGRTVLLICTFGLLFSGTPGLFADEETERTLRAFADPARVWGTGVEGVIEEAYRQCFKTYILDGKVMNLRMPFAQNNERDQLSDQTWEFQGGGKADPVSLWEIITGILYSDEFESYAGILGDGKEKVMILDIPTRTWTSSRDLFDIARMKAGAYRGLPHRPYVLVNGEGLSEADVYNYLYCLGWVGMDCSGFVWHTLSYIARKGGVTLAGPCAGPSAFPGGGSLPTMWGPGSSIPGHRKSSPSGMRSAALNLRMCCSSGAPAGGWFIPPLSNRWI
ncbi:hypothetical protein TREPR_3550 [Treponema primitia ZAS-2]|uniref:NlpC/P60 domain-containing protein n=1 Tax=Treponema primitia (strain ATCC BAA-887 / DSM 12427 / ZAS-2) TaxID=545694 RepID=F5YIC3_TREPZ|nr:hypothetical protein [Treponema primitia]AEF86929.1 hypothetical protein TREPR_3550 [Treponema primitia ZAS-2]